MKIRVFSADANPRVDAPLCRKSLSYVSTEIQTGRMVMLNAKEAQCVSRRPLSELTAEELVSAAHETACNSAISNKEMEANAGIAETQGAVLRAQVKIKAWMSPLTADERAPLPRGKWYDSSRIQVVVVQ